MEQDQEDGVRGGGVMRAIIGLELCAFEVCMYVYTSKHFECTINVTKNRDAAPTNV